MIAIAMSGQNVGSPPSSHAGSTNEAVDPGTGQRDLDADADMQTGYGQKVPDAHPLK